MGLSLPPQNFRDQGGLKRDQAGARGERERDAGENTVDAAMEEGLYTPIGCGGRTIAWVGLTSLYQLLVRASALLAGEERGGGGEGRGGWRGM